jgi:peptidoglycan/xylan/chitin deacetylase (PgdA/CDA1 family)
VRVKPLPFGLAPVLRMGASMLSGSGARASLLLLTFHRVLRESDPLLPNEPSAADFGAQLDLLRSLFNILTVREAVERRARNALPARSLCITFDDGYRNNAEVALPLLRARGLRATFFVSTGYLNGGRMFNDTVIEAARRAPEQLDLTDLGLGVHTLKDAVARRALADRVLNHVKYLEPEARMRVARAVAERAAAALPTDLMMTSGQVRELASAGMEIGAHTVSHPILARIPATDAEQEIAQSRDVLREMTGEPVTSFAYPNGRPGQDYRDEHVHMVRHAGYECAVSTSWGKAASTSDTYQLPRISPWDRSTPRYAARVLRSYLQ